MKQFSRIMLLALGFGLLVIALSSIPNHPAAAAPGSAPVTVENTATNPVPVSDVDNPARHPVSLRAIVSIVDGQVDAPLFFGLASSPSVRFFVPTGQTLVIEDISVFAELPAGQRVTVCSLEVTSITGATRGNFAPSFTAPKLDTSMEVSNYHQLTRAYFDAGTGVFMSCDRNSRTGSANFQSALQGYLVALR